MWNKKQKFGVIVFVVIHVLAVLARAQTVPEMTLAALQSYVQKYNTSVLFDFQRGGRELIKLEKVPSTGTDSATRLQARYLPEGLTYVLQYTEQALKNPEKLAVDLVILEASKARWEDRTIYTAAETMYNAEHGSAGGRYRLALQKKNFLQDQLANSRMTTLLANNDETLRTKIQSELQFEKEKLQASEQSLLATAEQTEKAKYKALEKYRAENKTLEGYEAQTEKLNDLLLKNDRKGVRQMLEAYLPWQVMEPMETQVWKTWLDAIENPDPTKTIVALRGVEYKTDKIQRLKLPNGQERLAFLSTVLTKNQGSYTRRLRSLTVNREKNGRMAEGVPGVQITNQMRKHSIEPVASSFLSFTLSKDTAIQFTGSNLVKSIGGVIHSTPNGGILAVRLDQRRLVPNIISKYAGEAELLAPLVIFPDEVVKYHEGSFNNYVNGFLQFDTDAADRFFAEVTEKTGVNFRIVDIELRNRIFLESGRSFFNIATQMPTSNMCSKVFP
ncbi:hypothetical protein [Bdellovibrio sp. HCB337]|uniref:hypothetical protein n=1 Tax=Bdellovibrio sp. HCB337 TaxID=3394358 RepID=UPI0039A71429